MLIVGHNKLFACIFMINGVNKDSKVVGFKEAFKYMRVTQAVIFSSLDSVLYVSFFICILH